LVGTTKCEIYDVLVRGATSLSTVGGIEARLGEVIPSEIITNILTNLHASAEPFLHSEAAEEAEAGPKTAHQALTRKVPTALI
jgi:hypothetical protein